TRRVSSSIAIGKFARWPVCGQGSDLFTLLQIDHGYLTGIWNIDESAGAAFFNLKTLRMRGKSDVGDLFAGARVDQSKRTLSISDQDSLAGDIDTNVIRVLSEIDTLQ